MQDGTPSALFPSVGLLILRLGIGGFMVAHGVGKLNLLIAGEFDALGDPVGIGGAATLVSLVFAEFLCALLVTVGLVTRVAAIPLVIAMGVAGFVAHAGDPWTAGGAATQFFAGEVEFPMSRQPALMFMATFLALGFLGPGRLSIDALIWPRLAAAGDNQERIPHGNG